MKNNKTANKLRKKVNKTLPNKQKEGMGTVKSILLGLGVYVLCALAVSLALSAVLVTVPDPDFLLFPSGMAVAALSAIVSAVVVKNTSKMPSLLSGVVSAVSCAALTLVFSLLPIMNRQNSPSFSKAVLFGVITLGSALGAHIGTKRQTKPRRHSR